MLSKDCNPQIEEVRKLNVGWFVTYIDNELEVVSAPMNIGSLNASEAGPFKNEELACMWRDGYQMERKGREMREKAIGQSGQVLAVGSDIRD
jgi:hypothetical protein